MLSKEELIRRVEEAHNIRRWYQKMPYGIDWPVKTHFEDGKTNEKSFGEGRWKNYIWPILRRNEDDWKNSTFCDVGCSAGLFLLRAWYDFGFKRLLGIEAADGGYAQLQVTKEHFDKMPLVTYKNALGALTETIADSKAPQINMTTFPIVDVTMMSCVHYHMDINYLKRYLRTLAKKSLYFLLLTDEKAGGPTNASSTFFERNIIGKDWTLWNNIYTPSIWLSDNPHNSTPWAPCKNITSLFYKSKLLKRLPVDECYKRQMNWHKGKGGLHEGWQKYAEVFYNEVFPQFIDLVLEGKINENNHRNCLVYDWQAKGLYNSTPWPPKVASERTLSYINIVKTVKDHGQEQPIALQEHLDMADPWDGWHRVAVLKHLGFKYVYGIDVIPEK